MIITRQEAIKQGLKKYYTGDPCVHGHYAERYVRRSDCVECKKNKKKKQRGRQQQERIEKYGQNGQKRYFTGEPCSKGHIADRLISNGHCVECKKEQSEAYRRKKGIKSIQETSKEKRLKTQRKKELKSKQYQASLLSPDEKSIVKYARDCLSRLNGRTAARVPTEVAEIECGYTYEELYQHLKNQKKGWGLKENRKRWHIDHIIPISRLVKYGVTEVSILNSLDNLKLLTAKQNQKKHAKLRMSQRKFEEYVVLKWSSCPQILGMYDPRNRRRRLVEEITIKIYSNLDRNVLLHNDFYRYDKATVIQAIQDDLYDGYSYRYSKGVTYREFMDGFSEYQIGSLESLLLEGYKPLRRLKKSNFKSFKYKDECEQYFKALAKKERNPICSQYLEKQAYEECRHCAKKGFLRSLFS